MKPRSFLVSALLVAAVCCSVAVSGTQCGSYSNDCQCGAVYCFSIEENSPSGTCIGHLVDLDGKVQEELQTYLDANRTLNFEISNTNVCGNPNVSTSDLFSITNTSLGTFSSVKELDYEDYISCGCLQLNFQVSYADGGAGSLTFFVFLDVVNVNDNPPIFQYTQSTGSTTYNISVDETDTTNTNLDCTVDLLATDQDDGSSNTNQITYEVLPPSSTNFSVSTNNVPELCILNLVPLDREAMSQVSFVISARDHGNLTSNITVVITLLDTNDNPPYFTQSVSAISVFENVSNGTVIAQYRASDVDLGLHAELTYSLSTDATIPFAIHQNGDLYVNGALDADEETGGKSKYTFNVIVTDGGGKQTSIPDVMVMVLDVNDNSLEFVSINHNILSISEGPTPVNQAIALFTIKDKDEVHNVTDEVLMGNKYVKLRLLQTTKSTYFFALVFNVSELDYEQTPEIFVNVSFTDDGLNYLTSSLVINVTDVNDNRPYLNQTEFYITESILPGETPLLLETYFRDDDSSAGNNNKLDRFVLDTDNEYVSISMRGEVRVKDIDREKIPGGKIIMNVTFFDQGDPQLNNTETITLNIIDVNDNPPVFADDQYNFEVRENEPAIDFGQVHAEDDDIGLNGKVIYQIIDSDLFIIDNVTGKLSTNGTLDREETERYMITVIATDMGSPSMHASTNVTISVIDVNDEVPKFLDDIMTQIMVDADTPEGTVIAIYIASDRDTSVNAVIRYALNDTRLFNINETTGHLRTVMELSNIYTDQIIMLTAFNENNRDINSTVKLMIIIEHKNVTIPIPTEGEGSTLLPSYAVVAGGVVLVLLVAILVVLCCLCCLCYYRKRHYKSRNLPPLPSQKMTPTKGIMKVSSFKEEDDAGYEGSANGDIPRSPTVNFSDNFQVRYFSQDQSMAKSSAINKTETVRIEEKLSTEFVESPQIPTKDNPVVPEPSPPEVEGDKVGEEVSSPPLSEDLSSNSSLSNSVYHSTSNQYYEHQQPKNQHLPLRVETLKKHNEAISSGLYPPQAHVGHDRLYVPPPHGNTSNGHYSHAVNEEDGFDNLPPNIQHYLSSNHHSNQSISASHYVSQNGSPPSADSSPSIQFISHSADHRANHRRLPHDKPTTLPSVYYNNHHVVSHAPLGPGGYTMDQPPSGVYYDNPPPPQKGGPLQHYASSSSSSNHRSDVSPPSPPQSYPPPPSSMVHHHHHRHGRHSRDDRHPTLSPLDECPPPHHSYTTHSTRVPPSYHHHPPPTVRYPQHHGPPHLYGNVVNMSSRQSLAVSEDNSTVASSVLDTYLQFDTHIGKHDDYLLSDAISVDDR